MSATTERLSAIQEQDAMTNGGSAAPAEPEAVAPAQKGPPSMKDRRTKLLARLDATWAAFRESYAGLPDAILLEPGVMGHWSVKDILAHVTTWEAEALKHLPLIIAGGTPPRYATVGGLDAFNARLSEQKRGLSLAEIQGQLDDTHRRLVEFIQTVPDDFLRGDSRARRRLRLDTYSHYPLHAETIRTWREQRSVA